MHAGYGCGMKRWLSCLGLAAFFVLAFPFRSPAPLIYTPGEGWVYEPFGSTGEWRKTTAKEQLKVAQDAFDKKDYGLAKKAANRIVKNFYLSDYAPAAEYLLARCYEVNHQDELAFKQYQKLLEKYPKAANYEDVLHRQFAICNRFLNGQRFKLWGYIPTFPSMDKTVDLLDKVVKNGPYSDVAKQAQMDMGAAREKQTRFLNDKEPYILAAKAYEKAADRYHTDTKVASEALYRAGLAYQKQAETAEYDQSTAGQAISTFQTFMTLYPDDPRVSDGEKIIASLKSEQARGNFETAKFYEFNHRWKSALIYYNEVVIQDPKSPYSQIALQRITELKKLTAK
jgi:outer membrane protein assembly factor BamD (BamD/ComL family)